MPHAYFLGGNGGAKRRSCRPDEGAYDLPSPCRTPSVRLSTSDCRPQGGHPCIERMRDAHRRSNTLRPLQRRFKARKKPEGYTSTLTGLKRLKTQNTAFHVNANGKGTPSGVPQPIHKRKLILVKEEFDASSSGGDGEDRTLDLHTASVALSQLSYAPKSSDDNDYQQDDYIPFFTVCQHKKVKFFIRCRTGVCRFRS